MIYIKIYSGKLYTNEWLVVDNTERMCELWWWWCSSLQVGRQGLIYKSTIGSYNLILVRHTCIIDRNPPYLRQAQAVVPTLGLFITPFQLQLNFSNQRYGLINRYIRASEEHSSFLHYAWGEPRTLLRVCSNAASPILNYWHLQLQPPRCKWRLSYRMII